MSDRVVNLLIVLSGLGSGLIAGVFFAFSSFVMAGLARLPVNQGISAMKSINITVINLLFMGVFFGTAVLCLALLWWVATHWSDPRAFCVLIGCLTYVIGSILVTMLFNVPLNNDLAVANAASTGGGQIWARYLSQWTWWNHVRGLASCVAMAAFLLAR